VGKLLVGRLADGGLAVGRRFFVGPFSSVGTESDGDDGEATGLSEDADNDGPELKDSGAARSFARLGSGLRGTWGTLRTWLTSTSLGLSISSSFKLRLA
jgi:hypothetical protein